MNDRNLISKVYAFEVQLIRLYVCLFVRLFVSIVRLYFKGSVSKHKLLDKKFLWPYNHAHPTRL